MAIQRKIHPFFSEFQCELRDINEQPETACKNLVARSPVFFQKILFRAFLHLTRKEIDEMSLTDYQNYTIMLKKVLELLHAPFLDHNK